MPDKAPLHAEVKAAKSLTDVDLAQILTYLKLSGCNLRNLP